MLFAGNSDSLTTFHLSPSTKYDAVVPFSFRGDTVPHPFFANLWSHDPQSPGRAALFSAVIPGLGQVYNRKAWKVPLVYASIGISAYFIFYWDSYYQDLKTAYIARTDGDSTTVDTQFAYVPSDASILLAADQVKRYVDLSVIITSAFYVLNIIDAIVDAHLYGFNVSNDLSMRIRPVIFPQNMYIHAAGNFPAAGLNIQLHFR